MVSSLKQIAGDLRVLANRLETADVKPDLKDTAIARISGIGYGRIVGDNLVHRWSSQDHGPFVPVWRDDHLITYRLIGVYEDEIRVADQARALAKSFGVEFFGHKP
jgi:hypothetical protein